MGERNFVSTTITDDNSNSDTLIVMVAAWAIMLVMFWAITLRYMPVAASERSHG
jgi:hypothetical protein